MSDDNSSRMFIGAPGADLDTPEDWLEVGYTHGHVPRPTLDLLDFGDTIEGFRFPTEDKAELTFTLVPTAGVTSDWFNLATGGATEVAEEPATHSITFDTTDKRPGDPPRPAPRTGWRGWWDRLTGKRELVLAEWRAEYQRWVDAGRPDVEVVTRFYIPRARLDMTP